MMKQLSIIHTYLIRVDQQSISKEHLSRDFEAGQCPVKREMCVGYGGQGQ